MIPWAISFPAFEQIAALKCEPGLQTSQILLADLDLNSATGMLLEVDDYLTLPLQPEALAESFEPYKRDHGLRQVLAVSDDGQVLDGISTALSDLPGLSISRAADAPEAIVMLSRQTPDLILLDITLPGAGALDALAAFEPELNERFIPCFGLLPESFSAVDKQRLQDLVYQLHNRARRPIPQHMAQTRARLAARQ